MTIAPGLDIRPINVLLLHRDEIPCVRNIFFTTRVLRPSQFGDDHILQTRNPHSAAHRFDLDPAAKTRLIVLIVAELEKFNLKPMQLASKNYLPCCGDAFKRDLRVEIDFGMRLSDLSRNCRDTRLNNDVGVLS